MRAPIKLSTTMAPTTPPAMAPTCELEFGDILADTNGLELAVGLDGFDVLDGGGLAVDSGLSEIVEAPHAAFSY